MIIESKILRKPIICTDFDGADEQIVHGKNGMIVPLNDVSALVEAIGQLIRYPQRRYALSEELEKWHQEDYLREIVKHFE